MTVLGIVAEYNPFHNGHLYHLSSAISAVCPDYTYVVLSGYFTQRGEPALLSPTVRASVAVEAGADAVFSLPFVWTVRNAENYALGAVSAICRLGCTHIAFGAETDNLPLLQKIASLLESPSDNFRDKLQNALSDGFGYPKALSQVIDSFFPDSAGIMSRPNNILAVCYLRAIIRLKARLFPVLVQRKGDYDADIVASQSPSASAIRSCARRGDWLRVQNALPDFSFRSLQRSFLQRKIPDPLLWDHLIIQSLRSISADTARYLPDISEGLDRKLLKLAATCHCSSDLIDLAVSKRYPAARINRILSWAVLYDRTKSLTDLPLPDHLQLLALRSDSVMTSSWKHLSVCIYSSLNDPEYSVTAFYEKKAAEIWALCTHQSSDMPYREKIYTK